MKVAQSWKKSVNVPLREEWHNKGTYENERDERQCSAAFTSSSNGNCADRGAENELEFTEENGRYRSNRFRQYTSVESILEVTNDTGTLSVRK
jgi:hypothetical protein